MTVGLQRPNQCLVIMPGCQHTVVNDGWSLGSAVNFVTAKHLDYLERGQLTNCLGADKCPGNYIATPRLDVKRIQPESNPDEDFVGCYETIYNKFRWMYGHEEFIPSIDDLKEKAQLARNGKQKDVLVVDSPDEAPLAGFTTAAVYTPEQKLVQPPANDSDPHNNDSGQDSEATESGSEADSEATEIDYDLKVVVKRKCDECPVQVYEFSLKRQKRSQHPGDLPPLIFGCSWPGCVKQYSEKGNMVKHYSLIHEGKRFGPCKYCGSTFATNQKLNQQINT